MSEQLPPNNHDELIRMSGDATWNAGYEVGVQDSMLRATQYERVLTDLIAELQDASAGYDPDCQSGCGDVPGAGCPAHYEQAVERAADRAEARLKELSNE